MKPTYKITRADGYRPLEVVCDLCGWTYTRDKDDPFADGIAAACHAHTLAVHHA